MLARLRATALRSSGRPTTRVDPVAHRLLRQLPHAEQAPAGQDRPLPDDDDQDELPAGLALLDPDVVELAGLEERGDGALDVAIGDRLVQHEPRGAEDLGGGERACCPRRRGCRPGARPRSCPRSGCAARTRRTSRGMQRRSIRGGRPDARPAAPAVRASGLARLRPASRSGRGTPAVLPSGADVDLDLVAAAELAEQDLLAERILDVALDRALAADGRRTARRSPAPPGSRSPPAVSRDLVAQAPLRPRAAGC